MKLSISGLFFPYYCYEEIVMNEGPSILLSLHSGPLEYISRLFRKVKEVHGFIEGQRERERERAVNIF